MVKKTFLIFVIIIANLLIFSSAQRLEEEDELDFADDPEISSLLNKYESEKKGTFTKENYKKLLTEILLASISEDADAKLSALEASFMTNIIYNYIDKKNQETFSYENMLADLESDEIMNELLKGLSEASEKMQTIQDKKEKADKISKKQKKKSKVEKDKKKKQKKQKKKEKKEEEGQCEVDQNDQCPIPKTENLENSKEINEEGKMETKSEKEEL